MSVINKALKDLEQRRGDELSQSGLSPQVRASGFAPRSRSGMFVVGGVIAVTAAAAGWYMAQHGQAPATSVAVAPAPAPAPAPVVVAVAKPEPAPAPAPAAIAVASATASAPTAAPAHKTAAAPAPLAVPVVAKPAPAPVAPVVAKAPPAPVAVAKAAPKEAKTDIVAPGIVKSATNTPPVEAALPPEARPVATAVAMADPKMEKTVAPQQLSDNLYKQAIQLVQQGNGIDARPILRKALAANPANAQARQLLANLLIEGNSLSDAEALLRTGVSVTPERPGLWMSLARLQLEQGDTNASLATLEQGASVAGDDPQYNAFQAALLQRAGRHDEAVKRFIVALRSDPSMPSWLVGAGISLQATGHETDAFEAFKRAKDGGRLTPQLAAFVDSRLEQLRR